MSHRTRLAVLGSPIAHSKSPALHAAAYAELGLEWEYTAVDVEGDELAAFVASLDDAWRGLSLTMPLKREMLPLLDRCDPVAALSGGVNTVVLDDGMISGFNTDVFGIVRALADSGLDRVGHVHLLGTGATAASMLIALHELGATSVFVAARTPGNAAPLVELGRRLGVPLVVGPLTTAFLGGRSMVGESPVGELLAGEPRTHDPRVDHPPIRGALADGSEARIDLVASALPGSARISVDMPVETRRATALFDVAYDPWPSALALAWQKADARMVVSGIEMLVNQALAQVRAFVTGHPDTVLPGEDRVLEVMRASVGLDASSRS